MLTTLLFMMLFSKKELPRIKHRTSNPELQTIKPGYPGTPLDQNGKFINEENPTIINYRQILKFLLEPNPQKKDKKNDPWRIDVLKNESWVMDPSDKIVWLGHAGFFVQLSGIRILIDPMFGELPVGKRYSENPVNPDSLHGIDYILVSHAHFDHCDKNSLKKLSAKNPKANILVGLELDKLIGKWVSNPIQTAGWYQQYQSNEQIKITFLPSRHWANRSPFDINTSLWGSFMIQSENTTIYFGGDSGHGSHFKTIGGLFPKIDIALIGAGAYAPTWFMGQHHQDPYHALDAFHAIGARTFIPFHYGTFDSADEPMGEPEKILSALNSEGKIQNQLKFLKLGEAYQV